MENLNIVFSDSLQQFLLKGATVIKWHAGKYYAMVLIRLPKDRFERIEDGRSFEYLEFHQGLTDKSMFVAYHRNGTKREVIGKAVKEFYEHEFHLSRQHKLQTDQ